LAKDRNRGNREPKKPKAAKKAVAATTGFIRPTQASDRKPPELGKK